MRARTGFDEKYFATKWGLRARDWRNISAGFKRPFDDFISRGMKAQRHQHPGLRA